MLPEYPQFKPLELSDRNTLERALASRRPNVCEMSFANLYIWKDFDDPKATVINGNVCLMMAPPDEEAYFLEPIGSKEIARTVDACLEIAGRISRVSRCFMERLPENGYSFHRLRDHHDYVYRTEAMAELKGRRFDGKRNRIKSFVKRFPSYGVVDIADGLRGEAFRVFDEWSCAKNGSSDPVGVTNIRKMALSRALDSYDELRLISCGIEAGGRLLGFLIANSLNAEVACIPFLYCIPGIQGLSQTLIWEACRRHLSLFKYVNMEQDLGIAGLRKYKESYYPHRMEEKFDVRRGQL